MAATRSQNLVSNRPPLPPPARPDDTHRHPAHPTALDQLHRRAVTLPVNIRVAISVDGRAGGARVRIFHHAKIHPSPDLNRRAPWLRPPARPVLHRVRPAGAKGSRRDRRGMITRHGHQPCQPPSSYGRDSRWYYDVPTPRPGTEPRSRPPPSRPTLPTGAEITFEIAGNSRSNWR
jgi:hypothetical protein